MSTHRVLALHSLCFGLVLAACGGDPDVTSERVVASPDAADAQRAKATKKPRGTPAASAVARDRRRVQDGCTGPAAEPRGGEGEAHEGQGDSTNRSRWRPAKATTRCTSPRRAAGSGRCRPAAVVLDISSEVTNNGEQGLLGLAFSPNGKRMYVYFTNRQGDQVVREYAFSGRARRVRAPILEMDDPYGNHNGGNIVFGPDGFLYIGTGDGGSAGDPQNRAQNVNDLLGKMLRIDPSKRSGSLGYGIPDSQPVRRTDGRDEIWAYGLRNPWRFSFDRSTGALWIGDVGQGAVGGDQRRARAAATAARTTDGAGWRARTPTRVGRAPSDHHGPIYEY